MLGLVMDYRRHRQNYRGDRLNKTLDGFFQKSFLAAFMLASAVPATAADAEHLKYLDESRKTAQEFMQTLGGTLKKQLELGGAESAIGVCKQVAPVLASEYSKNGRVVKRVSLKARNVTQGTPDAWESDVLNSFELGQQQGKPVAEMEFTQITTDADGRWFRYMKAIPTQAMCLQCHGQSADISPNVRKLLLQEYPEDKAVGFSAGQVRGAMSIKYQLGNQSSVNR